MENFFETLSGSVRTIRRSLNIGFYLVVLLALYLIKYPLFFDYIFIRMMRYAKSTGITWNNKIKYFVTIRLATKWLRILPMPPNDKIRNHLVANPMYIAIDDPSQVVE